MSSRQISERVVNSAIIGSSHDHCIPEETVRYIEVPVIEEYITHVPRVETIEIEKRVPKYNYEYIERIVEIPQIQTITKQVEVPEVREIIKHVPVKKVIDVRKEVIKYVPKIEIRVVEREVEVPGEVIEIPMPYTVENQVVVAAYVDSEVPTVVAQKVQPIVFESTTETLEVELREYDPYLVPVDVYVPRPVQRNFIPSGKQEEHRIVDVPVAQYNALVKQLNQHVSSEDTDGLYRKTMDGTIPMFHGPGSNIVPPIASESKQASNGEYDHRRQSSSQFMSSNRSYKVQHLSP